jgi:hypothetical protein
MVKKGKILNIVTSKNQARVKDIDGITTWLLNVPKGQTVTNLHVGDKVVYAIFDDMTGIILHLLP